MGVRIKARGREKIRLTRLILKVDFVSPWLLSSASITYIPKPVQKKLSI